MPPKLKMQLLLPPWQRGSDGSNASAPSSCAVLTGAWLATSNTNYHMDLIFLANRFQVSIFAWNSDVKKLACLKWKACKFVIYRKNMLPFKYEMFFKYILSAYHARLLWVSRIRNYLKSFSGTCMWMRFLFEELNMQRMLVFLAV